ncbi:metal-dependent hydrolase [Alcanivorax sp. JB21]|uniref:metal-dependent hydrolase n=1 Tax=Alcanivorax limicola TaxID=2874102 RepID=UPI001CBDD39D|nr:metal-dependent hydrolase [Alcanivorax limicola]MBZ2190424.1 metal-dependent hydrolase [Alcanivorax limicola]
MTLGASSTRTASSTNTRHRLQARRVAFDLSRSPLHWIPGDPLSSHLINGINLLLPAGELWFCRVYNQALLHITDPILREDVQGFIRQEGMHAQAHRKAELWLQEQGMDVSTYRRRVDFVFQQLLGDAPLGLKPLQHRWLARHWLIARVGIVAAIEHFTGLLGDWCMNSDSWDKADPVVADLFRWHLAEEVEHRSVAFDLYAHLCRTQTGFYLSRQALMALVFPLFLQFIAEGGRSLAGQDPDPAVRKLARRTTARILLDIERIGRRNDNVPTFSLIARRTLRWVAPGFHPESEGDTAQAMAYIARSPAATAGALNRAS